MTDVFNVTCACHTKLKETTYRPLWSGMPISTKAGHVTFGISGFTLFFSLASSYHFITLRQREDKDSS